MVYIRMGEPPCLWDRLCERYWCLWASIPRSKHHLPSQPIRYDRTHDTAALRYILGTTLFFNKDIAIITRWATAMAELRVEMGKGVPPRYINPTRKVKNVMESMQDGEDGIAPTFGNTYLKSQGCQRHVAPHHYSHVAVGHSRLSDWSSEARRTFLPYEWHGKRQGNVVYVAASHHRHTQKRGVGHYVRREIGRLLGLWVKCWYRGAEMSCFWRLEWRLP